MGAGGTVGTTPGALATGGVGSDSGEPGVPVSEIDGDIPPAVEEVEVPAVSEAGAAWASDVRLRNRSFNRDRLLGAGVGAGAAEFAARELAGLWVRGVRGAVREDELSGCGVVGRAGGGVRPVVVLVMVEVPGINSRSIMA